MEITEVRIKLMEDAGERLQAFCSITFDDCFVIRDLKIIEGTNGPFVAMPSRKLTAHCPQCGYKNHLRAQFCNQCGQRQKEDRAIQRRGRPRQALRRHCPSDQFALPRDDPGPRDPHVSRGVGAIAACPVTSRVTRISTTSRHGRPSWWTRMRGLPIGSTRRRVAMWVAMVRPANRPRSSRPRRNPVRRTRPPRRNAHVTVKGQIAARSALESCREAQGGRESFSVRGETVSDARRPKKTPDPLVSPLCPFT